MLNLVPVVEFQKKVKRTPNQDEHFAICYKQYTNELDILLKCVT